MPIKRAIFDKKNVLVVGGAGFVGSHLCDELIKTEKVICIDNFLTGQESNIEHLLQNQDFKFINHNIIDPIDLEKLPELANFRVEFQGLQEIYFLASPTSPQDYIKYPLETLLVNSVGLRNCLDLAVKYKSQLLYASSPAVYGAVSQTKPIKEDYVGLVDQLSPRACFAEAKRFGETLVNNYRQVNDLDTKIVRIFNCYGPRMRLDDGRMIPEIVRSAVEARDITVYGSASSVGSYFYISDLIRGLVKMMESGQCGPLNLASEWKTRFSEVVDKTLAITGSKSAVKYQKTEKYMGEQFLADITLAKEELGWFPIILLEDGLTKTIDYLKAQEGIRKPENSF
ncbi:MAG: NAD-dependent epimerase/dehydratase family protein [Patescibacteria group bacterium]